MLFKSNINQGVMIPPNILKEAGITSDFEYELSIKDSSIIVRLLTDKQTKQLEAIDGLCGLLRDDENIISDILGKRVNFLKE